LLPISAVAARGFGCSEAGRAAALYQEAAEADHTYIQWRYGLNPIAGRDVARNEALGLEFIR